MDWYLDTKQAGAVTEVKEEISAYLGRHATEPDSVGQADAEIVIAEILGNVVRHAAGPAWVSLVWSGPQPVLTVYDLGPGFVLDPKLPDDTLAEGGRGLFIVSHLAEHLTAASRASGGTRVSAQLPVTRVEVESYDPPVHLEHALPTLDEALPGGGFGKESFLRALVVQLAQAVERTHGPGSAEAAVAQVGADVGGQMEAEYRVARNLVGRLTPDQIADCYLRLKHAIDGEFFVIEASADRIVLGNSRCPFGDVVRQAPALCRMTSSVFGGIAARNSDHRAAVVLEERIAVGDPGCRIVVHLDTEPEEPGAAHHYRTPEPTV